LGRATTTHYDGSGRALDTVDALGRTTRYVYDAAGKLTETDFDDGTSAKLEYDPMGRKAAEVDSSGRRSEFAYDPMGRLTQVTLAAGTAEATVTRYIYDELGNRTTQTDAESRATSWAHDSVGRETARALPLGQRESNDYDLAGRPIVHTDFNGRATHFAFDALNRLVAIDYPNDADVAIEYTASGQRAKVTDGHGVTTYSYDPGDRLLRKVDSAGRVIEYSYDLAGNLISRVTASQSLVYTYDALNRMTSVTSTVGSDSPTVTRYEYDAVGNRTAMVSHDGIRTEYGYDRRNRLTSLAKKTAVGALLLGMTYTVDASGLRTNVEETDVSGVARTVAYQYDGLKRLTREAIVARDPALSRTATWTYDKVGNRLTQAITPAVGTPIATSYVYDRNDRLTSETTGGETTTYSYDANGNTLTRSKTGQIVEYVYDDANRLAQLRLGGDRTTYAYDVDGLRIAQTGVPASGPSITTAYLVDSNRDHAQVIEEWTSSGAAAPQLAAVFTFGDDLIAQTRDGVTRFVHADGFGNTRWLTDASGAFTDTITFDAFGNQLTRTGTTEIEHLYRAEQFDQNSGFYYLRARYLDPRVGRFVSQDTFAGGLFDPVGLHKYLYANADPINKFDPTGMYTQDFGYEVEKVVNAQYLATHNPCACYFGTPQWYSFERYLKPDIMNFGLRLFNEIKPLSLSGIYKGGVQIAVYSKFYGLPPWNFNPDTSWTPVPAIVDGTFTYFLNLGGVVFYSDDEELHKELVAATLATVAYIVRQHATKVATRLGADAVARAALTLGLRTIAGVNAGRLVQQASLAILLPF
jgi:RHS repeat-associated protein